MYFDKTKSLFGKTVQPYTLLLMDPIKVFDKQTYGMMAGVIQQIHAKVFDEETVKHMDRLMNKDF